MKKLEEILRKELGLAPKMSIRAKFCVVGLEYMYGDTVKYKFRPVYEPDVPEDQKFAKHTPSGELWMIVDNPSAKFELGKNYYLTFDPVDL